MIALEKSLILADYLDLKDEDFPVKYKGSFPGRFNEEKYFLNIVENGEHRDVSVILELNGGKELNLKVIDMPDFIKPKNLKPFFKWYDIYLKITEKRKQKGNKNG